MTATDGYGHILAFREAMEKHGLVFKGEIEPDGVIHRVHIEGDHNGSKNGWYLLHLDSRPAGAFGCWKKFQDQRFKWKADLGSTPLTREERAELRAKIDADKARRAAEQQAKHDDAAARANAIWDAAVPAMNSHPYLKKKGIGHHGIRVGEWSRDSEPDKQTGEFHTLVVKNALLIPIKSGKAIVSLQAIFPSEKNALKRGKDYFRDGKKRGCYLPIGTGPVEFDGVQTFVFCEGFATGASIYEATGLFTIVCFDVSNLLPVAAQFREHFPKARLIIAADNDAWTLKPIVNPGVHHGRKAAEAVNGILAIPQFKSVVLEPTDFNDLASAEGIHAVKAQIEAAINPPAVMPDPVQEPAPPPEPVEPKKDIGNIWSGPIPLDEKTGEPYEPTAVDDPYGRASWFRILGIDKEIYQIYHAHQRQVLNLPVAKFGQYTTYTQLADLTWWQEHFPSKGEGFNIKAAGNWIQRTAERRPGFDRRSIRGCGAWTDDGRTVFHLGDILLVDGVLTDLAVIKTKFIYERSDALPRPADTALTVQEGRAILDAMTMFRWVRPASAPIALGWAALAPICGLLKWRPHIWLTGAAGSGKSTIQVFMNWLLNGASVYALGSSTEAGIRQAVCSNAFPVLFDESEKNTDHERVRMDAVIALIRQASSKSPARTLKGTSGGVGMSWHIMSMFCLASIQVGLTNQADKDRFAILNLHGHRAVIDEADREPDPAWKETKAALYAIGFDPDGFDLPGDVPERFVRRVLDMVPTTLANIAIFIQAAADKFDSQRDGDQYGTLMAGCWSLISDGVATPKQARDMLDGYEWQDHVDSTDVEDDASRALSVLLGCQIPLPHGTKATVDELVSRAAGYVVESLDAAITKRECAAVLRRHGMVVSGTILQVSNTSNELLKLVADTPYSSDLKGQLLRTTGAEIGRDPTNIKFSGLSSRYITLPLAGIIDPCMSRIDAIGPRPF